MHQPIPREDGDLTEIISVRLGHKCAGMLGGRVLRPGAPPAGRARAGPHRGLPGACRAGVPERRRGPPRASGAAAGPGPRGHDADVVVVGAGISGLCCGALLAKYG